MSMDEQFDRLRVFETELVEFNETLRVTLAEVDAAHGAVDPLWKDSMRKTYDALWNDFHQDMARYVEQSAPRVEEFLLRKIQHLHRYLHGD